MPEELLEAADVHVDAGQLTRYAGDYQYYLDKSKAANAREALTSSLTNQPVTGLSSSKTQASSGNRKEQKRQEAEQRNARNRERRQLEEQIAQLEADLEKSDTRKTEIESQLQDPATYANTEVSIALQKELTDLETQIEKLTGQWESMAEKLEA